MLTRREFAAHCAGGFALFAGGATRARADLPVTAQIGPVRHAHAEIGAGPWTRAKLGRIAERIASANGMGPAASMTSLGIRADAPVFPEEFVVTLAYANGARLILRANRRHQGPADVVVRREIGSREFRMAG
jgi:hypothetical protein